MTIEKNMPSICWQTATLYCESQQTVKSLLLLFINSFNEIEQLIQTQTAYLPDNEEQLNHDMLLAVHKLHGACQYCGAIKLKHLCFDIEQSLRAGKSVSVLSTKLLELSKELNTIRHYVTSLST